MPRSVVPVTAAAGVAAGVEVVKDAADAANDHKVANPIGSRVLIFIETGGTQITATIKGVSQIVHVDDIVEVCEINKIHVFGPYAAPLFTQPSGVDAGSIQIDLDVDTAGFLFAIAF